MRCLIFGSSFFLNLWKFSLLLMKNKTKFDSKATFCPNFPRRQTLNWQGIPPILKTNSVSANSFLYTSVFRKYLFSVFFAKGNWCFSKPHQLLQYFSIMFCKNSNWASKLKKLPNFDKKNLSEVCFVLIVAFYELNEFRLFCMAVRFFSIFVFNLNSEEKSIPILTNNR